MAISYNEPITFGRFGSAKALNCTGIDFSENGAQSWTSSPVAELDIQLPFARQDVMLHIEAAPYVIPDMVPVQKMFIFVAGLFTGYTTLTTHGTSVFPVNRSVVSGRAARMSLVIPTAVSPSALGISEDMRELGIYLTSITFKTTP